MKKKTKPSFWEACVYAVRICAGGLKKGRSRRFWERMKNFLDDEMSHAESLLPTISSGQLLPQRRQIQLHEVTGGDGNVSDAELVALAMAAAAVNGRDIFEIGTFDGRTTLNLAANAPDSRVFTLDLPPEELDKTGLPVEESEKKYINKPASGSCFKETSFEPQITQLWGDSAKFDFTPYKGKCGLIFVDGSHAREYVLNDARVALELLDQSGGYIFFHDYGTRWWDGVTQALNELMQSDSCFSELKHVGNTSLVVLNKL